MNLTRHELVEGDYKWPEEFVRVRPTHHFTNRLAERGLGLETIPKLIKITKDNIYSGKTNGKVLNSVVVRLKYGSYKYIFICFNPHSGAAHTLWFKEIQHGSRGITDTRTDNQQAV